MLLVCKTFVKFELVENASIQARIYQSVVLVPFLILLPLEIDEGVGRVFLFDPDCTGLEDSSNEIFVVTLSQVKLRLSHRVT